MSMGSNARTNENICAHLCPSTLCPAGMVTVFGFGHFVHCGPFAAAATPASNRYYFSLRLDCAFGTAHTHALKMHVASENLARTQFWIEWQNMCVCDGWWVMAERVNDAHTSVSHIEMLNKNDNKIKWCCPSTINDETTIRVATSHSTISVIKLYAIEWNENRTSIDIIDIGGWPLFDVKLPINDVLIEFFCFNLHHFSVVCCCCYYRWLKWQKNKKSSFNWFVGTPQTRVDPNDRRDQQNKKKKTKQRTCHSGMMMASGQVCPKSNGKLYRQSNKCCCWIPTQH